MPEIKTAANMTMQELAELKIDTAIEALEDLQADPSLIHTQDGVQALIDVNIITEDLLSWLYK